jgi:FixJ family two-component response regulator
MLRVYIVDDDASVLNALKRLLKSVDIGTEVFSKTKEFFASDYKSNAHCLVLDVHMLGGSGFELKKNLDLSGSKLPVIFMTAHDNEETRQKAKNLGAFAYLQKPFEDHELIDTIFEAVGREAS